MTTTATRLRDAVYERVIAARLFQRVSKQGMPQVQPDDLPYAAVFIQRERLQPDGDGNAGDLAFISDVTIAIQVVRGFEKPEDLDADTDADIDAIEDRLFSDPVFTAIGTDGYFESVSAIERERSFPSNGEAYFSELRLAITFRTRVAFEPKVIDDYEGFDTTTRPMGHADAPAIHSRFDQSQD